MVRTSQASVWLLLLGAAAGQSSHCTLKGCFSSVFASRSAVASSDCQSYFRVTKSPCPASGTTTVTGPPTTVTVTAKATSYSKTVYDISTTVSTSLTTLTTVVSTVSSTELDTVSEYDTETDTALAAATTTVATTSTVTTDIIGPTPPARKRDLVGRAGCTPVTYAPTAIPSYASACGAKPGNVQYYSACSCYGATQTTTTLPQSTVIVSTVTVTPKVTVTTTATVSGGKKVLTLTTTLSYQTSSTSTTSQTLTSATTQTVATITSTIQTVTVSSTSTSTTTQSVIQTGCPLVATDSPVQGQHLVVRYGPFAFTTNVTEADLFYLQGGELYVSAADNFHYYANSPTPPGTGLRILFDSNPDNFVIFDGSVYQDSDYYVTSCRLGPYGTFSCAGTGAASSETTFGIYHSGSEYYLTVTPSTGYANPVNLIFDCTA